MADKQYIEHKFEKPEYPELKGKAKRDNIKRVAKKYNITKSQARRGIKKHIQDGFISQDYLSSLNYTPLNKNKMDYSKKQDEKYDAKMAYNKNLSGRARLHYLENNIADHKGGSWMSKHSKSR